MAFTGKVALITGGGSGMGQRAARVLAEQGASVAALDVNEAGLAETAEGHSNIKTYTVDITNNEAVNNAVKSVESELGPIDRVANAAAIMPFGKLLEQDAAIQHKLMEINFGGLVNIATASLPGMMERGRGDFISFASMSGIIPGLLTGGYTATKAAVVAYTEVLYHENRNKGVRFACVCPPPVATPLWKQAHDTVMPKIIEAAPPIESQEVLDEIEKCLEADKFWVFPGKQTRTGYIMRRLFPNYVWNHVHKTEGF